MAIRKSITRFSLEAKISCKGKYQKAETTAYWRSNHWVPDVDFPDEFYGFAEVSWTNVYERTVMVAVDVRFVTKKVVQCSEFQRVVRF